MRTRGEDKGWYYANVALGDVRTVLELSTTRSDPQLAYESLLQNYCLTHLSEIEPGLVLYRRGRTTGAEFDAGGCYIDILARDSAGALVVIELKLPRAHDRAIGQILRYIEWVRRHVAKTQQRVRGIIIARHITDDLRLAAAGQPDITLKEYALSITIKDAQPGDAANRWPLRV
jgi:RecB family endonuclease NucS